MNGSAGDARTRKTAAASIGAVLGAAEHDDAARPLALEYTGEQGVLRFEGNREHVLLNRFRRRGHRGDLDAGGIVHKVGDRANCRIVKRCGEQQGLAIIARVAHDAANGGQKAHVEHAVRLVEHEYLHLVEHARALIDEVL